MTTFDISGKFLWDKSTESQLKSHLTCKTSVLNLSTNHIGKGSIKLIIDFIKNEKSNLNALIFDQCRMCVESTCKLFDALPDSRIKYLSMDRNVLTLEACKAFADATNKGNLELEFVSFRECDIPADGCLEIAGALKNTESLRILCLDSNCIFDKGAIEIAKHLNETKLEEISLSDNHIWKGGTNELIREFEKSDRLKALDISYNIVDLELLGDALLLSRLKALSISGCKVLPNQVLPFINNLVNTSLETLIIEGLNTKSILPVSWPHVKDELCENPGYLDKLIDAMKKSKCLKDLRVGFLSIESMNKIKRFVNKNMTITMNDFGRNGDTWVLNLPEFSLDSPSSTFKWCEHIQRNEALFLIDIFNNSNFEGNELDSFDISKSLTDDYVLQTILTNFVGKKFKLLDFSDNPITDCMIHQLICFLNKSFVEEFRIKNTKITENGFKSLFLGINNLLPKLEFSFTSYDYNERTKHLFINPLAELIGKNNKIEELTINGPITAMDLKTIFEKIRFNSHLKKINIEMEIPSRYKVPEPMIDESLQEDYNQMVDTLSHVLNDKDSKCVLQYFSFPLLTKVFLHSNFILNLWGDIEMKMESKKTPK